MTYDLKTNDLVSNPVPELLSLRGASVASEQKVALAANSVHHVEKTAGGAAASADIEVNFTVPQGGGSFGACVLAKPPGSKPFVPHWEVVPNSNAAYDKVGVPGKARQVSSVIYKLASHDCGLLLAVAAAAAQVTRLRSLGMRPTWTQRWHCARALRIAKSSRGISSGQIRQQPSGIPRTPRT